MVWRMAMFKLARLCVKGD